MCVQESHIHTPLARGQRDTKSTRRRQGRHSLRRHQTQLSDTIGTVGGGPGHEVWVPHAPAVVVTAEDVPSHGEREQLRLEPVQWACAGNSMDDYEWAWVCECACHCVRACVPVCFSVCACTLTEDDGLVYLLGYTGSV